jgi:hypothetical protein
MAPTVSDDILAVWSSSEPNGARNFEYGIETQTWGFKSFHEDYERQIRWILFGYSHSNGSPRMTAELWREGTADLVLTEVTNEFYTGHAPHWPDEVEANQVIYPCRVGIVMVGSASGIAMDANGPLGIEGSEALRRSGTDNRGAWFRHDLTDLREALHAPIAQDGSVDHSRTPGTTVPTRKRNRRASGQGRSVDAALNAALEKHAMTLATEYYRHELGWTQVKPLGKPFDLVCIKESGEEKHVEVKGTTGAGNDVIYTPNEIKHFRECPYGADLVVVRDIEVDRTTTPYTTSGGELLHVENYEAPPEDLTATGWTGRVNGW